VITNQGAEGEIADYYRNRGILMEWSYNGEESEEENLERFYRDFACSVKK